MKGIIRDKIIINVRLFASRVWRCTALIPILKLTEEGVGGKSESERYIDKYIEIELDRE